MLRCFVAMRIGDSELDRLLDRAVIPTLRGCGVQGIRVDRVVHNEDVDDRIIRELNRADMVLADLTFARPSVYFEAGWAEGLGTPVIYTCRRDHLHAREDDELGNLRVHFDLQMKNIIPWSSASEKAFRKRLEQRVRFVSRPILQRQEREARARNERAEFEGQSVRDRLSVLVDVATRRLKAAGFSGDQMKEGEGLALASTYLNTFVPKDAFTLAWTGARRYPGRIEGAFLLTEENLTQRRLQDCARFVATMPPHDMNLRRKIRPRVVREHIILCSLRSVPDARVTAALTRYRQVQSGYFIWQSKQIIPKHRVGNQLLFLGGRPYSGAIGFLSRNDGRSIKHYENHGQRLAERTPGISVVSFPGGGKGASYSGLQIPTKVVPRIVHLYVLSNIHSSTDFEEILLRRVLPVIASASDDIITAAAPVGADEKIRDLTQWAFDTGL